MKKDDGEEISYESLRQERIKENMERMQKLGVSDLSKKLLKSKPPPLPPMKKKKTTTEANIISQPSRRSSRLQNLTPVSYIEDDPPKKTAKERSNLPKTPKEPRNPHNRSNHMKDEEEDEDEDEDEDEEEEDDDEYNLIGFNPDLCGRRSSRLQQAPQVSYAEISPIERSEIEIEDETGIGKDVLVGEGRKPAEEHEKGAEQRVSAKRYISFDNVQDSLHPIESVNSPTDGKPLDVYVGEVTSSQLT